MLEYGFLSEYRQADFCWEGGSSRTWETEGEMHSRSQHNPAVPSGWGLQKSQGTLSEFWSILARAHAAAAACSSLFHSLLEKTTDSLARGSYESPCELSLPHSCARAGRVSAETTLFIFQSSAWVMGVVSGKQFASAAIMTYGLGTHKEEYGLCQILWTPKSEYC